MVIQSQQKPWHSVNLTNGRSASDKLEDLYPPLKQERILWDSTAGIFYWELWLLSQFLFPVGSIGLSKCFYFEVGEVSLLVHITHLHVVNSRGNASKPASKPRIYRGVIFNWRLFSATTFITGQSFLHWDWQDTIVSWITREPCQKMICDSDLLVWPADDENKWPFWRLGEKKGLPGWTLVTGGFTVTGLLAMGLSVGMGAEIINTHTHTHLQTFIIKSF